MSSKSIYQKNQYCVYLTIYSGNKLPPFYIGSTSVERINNGYHGSVNSREYKKIWVQELKNNYNLFKTIIISTHTDRKSALISESNIHTKFKVNTNPLYINRSIASINGCFGVSLFGKNNPNYGKKLSIERRKHLSNLKNNVQTGYHWFNNGTIEIFKKDCPPEFSPGRLESYKISQRNENNNSYGKKWWTDGVSNVLSENCPDRFYLGFSTNKNWYTNGIDDVFSDICPNGWQLGRTNGVSTFKTNQPSEIPFFTMLDSKKTYTKNILFRLYPELKNPSLSPLPKWIITTPTGETIVVDILSVFCKDNNLAFSAMSSVAKGNRNHHKGYKVKKSL